jgi:hypothetical protein
MASPPSRDSMPYLAGVVLALIVSVYATVVDFDRDRAFYPTVLVVVASYYVLFAVMGGTSHVPRSIRRDISTARWRPGNERRRCGWRS